MPAGSSAGGHSGKLPATDKLSKGLRHFSWRVCEKVQQKKVTTYNEVCVGLGVCWLGYVWTDCTVHRKVVWWLMALRAEMHVFYQG